jgi:hypothetical protein
MSERPPEEGDDVVIQTTDGDPLFFGYVRSCHIHGSLECSPRPVSFRLVYRWLLVPKPPDMPHGGYDDSIPF